MQYGTIRKIDKLGRIVIPKDMREFFKIKENEELELKAIDQGVLITISNIEVKRTDESF